MKLGSVLLIPLLMGTSALAAGVAKKPNFVVILTDDQDHQMKSMDYLPKIKKHLTDHGMYCNHHYATVALCCPSRASGYPKFISEEYHKKWLPASLQAAGYRTYFAGKLMNYHTHRNYVDGLEDMGLTGHDFMIEPGTYQYLNTTFQHNMEHPKSYPGEYATDLLTNKSLAWIDEAAKARDFKPFFLAINPVNPHHNFDWRKGWGPPVPAPRHKNKFPDAIVPRDTDNFNPDKPSGASWVRQTKKLSDKTVKENDEVYRLRLQALQSVDDLVEQTIKKLEEHKMLDNTYIIYTSDNGFHIGQHRLTPGKRCPYEEDINVPLVIRGPDIPKGKKVDFVTSHLDIVPTILNWAGVKASTDFDGKAIPATGDPSSEEPWEHVQIEHWGAASDKRNTSHQNIINTYKAARIIGPKYNLGYMVWCDGDHEIYDMTSDPYQMNNLYNSTQPLLGVSMQKLADRLDTMLLVLKKCSRKTCRRPWEALHPDGKVKTLVQALEPEYDEFYRKQNKVRFAECKKAYFVSNELPVDYHTYGNGSAVQAPEVDWWMNVG